MELIKINNEEYEFVKDYRNDEELRKEYNNLTEETFCFNFENWYKSGYWNEKHIPYSLRINNKIVSNVSVNLFEFIMEGTLKRAIQIGTVMTEKNYRKKGLNKYIMERILKEWENKCDFIYLFGNDSVLNYYPKFGFKEGKEYKCSKKVTYKENNYKVRKLNMKDNTDRNLLYDKAKEGNKFSKVSVKGNEDLTMFYCIGFMENNIYYIEEFDAIIVAEYEDENLYIQEIYGGYDLNSIIEALLRKETKKVIFGFTPLEECDIEPLKEEDCTLFIKGNIQYSEKFMFPVLSHT